MLPPTSISFYGKLPWVGDFIVRNLEFTLHRQIDRWLSAGLSALRDTDPNWLEAYLSAPVWSFILPAGVWGEQAVCGAIMPSVDKVGRYFPFILFFNQDAVADIHLRNQYLARIAVLLPGLLQHETLVDDIFRYIAQGLVAVDDVDLAALPERTANFFHVRETSGYWWNEDGDAVLNHSADVGADIFIRLFGDAQQFYR